MFFVPGPIMTCNRRRQKSGYTLIEVLVASLILTTGVIALAELFIISTSANRVARATSSTIS